MADDATDPARPTKALPAQPNLEHLKKEAKQRLKAMRSSAPQAKLAAAQLAVARDYGFASWRRLKAQVEEVTGAVRKRVFQAARAGDFETVRQAFVNGFDPGALDGGGQTVHQIAKVEGWTDIELLARTYQESETTAPSEQAAIDAVLDAAEHGRGDELIRLLDARPDLIDARGGNFQKQTALHKAAWHNQRACVKLLLERGANVRLRDYGDNAYALHFAAEAADVEVVKLLVEAGSDIVGEGDDHQLGVLGWATCFRKVREEVADYLLRQGAKLNLWSAIALDRPDAVRGFIDADRSLLSARMSRNEHHRTPLHHAAAKNRGRMVQLLIDLGADVSATDSSGATPLTTASQESADADIIAMLLSAGAQVDFISAVNLKRYELAEAMLQEDPARIGPQGRDTVALHLAASKGSIETVRWLIEHGIDVDAKRDLWDSNHTALHVTAGSGAIEIARMLLDAGADPNIHDDKYDATVLGWAKYCGHEQLAQLVRERGGRER